MFDIYYDCNETLPDNVKAALDEKGQEKWRQAFNGLVKKSKNKKSYRDATFEAWQVLKSYPGCRYFSAIATSEALDRQNDVVQIDNSIKNIAKHIERGGAMVDTHTNRTVGSFFYGKPTVSKSGHKAYEIHGVIYQGEPYYNTVWDQIKKGAECPSCGDIRKGISIGGFALQTQNSCDAAGCHREIMDMSIHEISICREPANPEALIQDVNVMAKSVDMDEKIDDVEKAIDEMDKALRDDEPAPMPEQPVMPTAPQQAAEPAEEDYSTLTEKLKRMTNAVKGAKKVINNYEKLMATMQDDEGMEPTAKSCGCMDTDVHTPITTNTCPQPKELYGDVRDPQIKGNAEFIDNNDMEPDEAAKKDHGDLLPFKEEMEGVDFKDAKEGPTQETKVVEVVAKPVTKAGGCGKGMTTKDAREKLKPLTGSNTITDKGITNLRNFGKETGNLMQKSEEEELDEDYEDFEDEASDYAEIPSELMPLFQEFLQEKGIKIEPEVESEEIEAPLVKTLHVDLNISELDVKELSNAELFKSYEALGRIAGQKVRLRAIDTMVTLNKGPKVADLQYLLDTEVIDELRKSKKNEPIAKVLPVLAAAGGAGAAGAGGAAAGGASGVAGGVARAAGKMGGLGGGMPSTSGAVDAGIKTAGRVVGSGLKAAGSVLNHAQAVASGKDEAQQAAQPTATSQARERSAQKQPVAPAQVDETLSTAMGKAFEDFQKSTLGNIYGGIKGGYQAAKQEADKKMQEYQKWKDAQKTLNDQEAQAGKRGVIDQLADYRGDSSLGNVVSGGAQMARGLKRVVRGAKKKGQAPTETVPEQTL